MKSFFTARTSVAFAYCGLLLSSVANPIASQVVLHVLDDEPSAKIMGGNISRTAEYPFVVALESKYRTIPGWGWTFCTASLIAPDTVLTAAHCLEDDVLQDIDNGDIRVVAGVTNLYTDIVNETRQTRILRRSNVWMHPEYRPGKNDIAMVHLDVPFELGQDIQPIRLAFHDTDLKELERNWRWAKKVGWGHINLNKDTAPELRELDTILEPCDDTYYRYCICNSRRSISDVIAMTRPGDSGGPLFVTDANGERVQIGVHFGGVGKGGFTGGQEKSAQVSAYEAEIKQMMEQGIVTPRPAASPAASPTEPPSAASSTPLSMVFVSFSLAWSLRL